MYSASSMIAFACGSRTYNGTVLFRRNLKTTHNEQIMHCAARPVQNAHFHRMIHYVRWIISIKSFVPGIFFENNKTKMEHVCRRVVLRSVEENKKNRGVCLGW